MTRKLLSATALGVACVVATAMLSGCHSGQSASAESGGARCIASAKSKYAADLANMKLTVDQTPLDLSKIKGRSVWYIAPDMSIPFIKAISVGFTRAAEAAGLKPVVFDGQGQVGMFNQGVSSAVAQGAAGILLPGINPELVSGPLADAEKRGVIVVDSLTGGPDQPLTHGVKSHVTEDFAASGSMAADYVAATSGCAAESIFVTSNVFDIYKDMQSGYEKELAALCGDHCKNVDTINVTTPDLATKLAGLVTTSATRRPDAHYVVAAYDGMVSFLTPALAELGRNDISIVSHDGVTANLEQIRAGKGLQKIDVSGPPDEAIGWAQIDQLARLLAGQKVPPVTLPQQTFRQDNLPDNVGDVAALAPAYGSYESMYRHVWGLQ